MQRHQLPLIHVAKRQLGLDDADYRQILREKAGVESSKDLSNRGLEDVMAHFEYMGFRMTGKPADYSRKRQFHRGVFADPRQVHLIRELAPRQRYPLAAVCDRFTKGRVSEPEQLTAKEAFNVIEMLNAVIARDDKQAMECQTCEQP